jgi:hypothetical protein
LHLLRPAAGTASLAELRGYQAERWNGAPGTFPEPYASTRNRPTRAAELLDGGSLYWVIKGRIQARQRLAAIEEATSPERGRFWLIRLEGPLIETLPVPHRPFQGWRYLPAERAPPDLDRVGAGAADMPAALAAELRKLGLL